MVEPLGRFVVCLALLSTGVVAQERREPAPATRPARRIVYSPPDRGAPVTRVGSGTRGPDGKLPALELIAPKQTGLTSMRRPTLYWYLSDPTDADVVITLTDMRTRETILERVERGMKKAGLHRIHPEDRLAELMPGHQYRLVVLVDANKKDDEGDPTMSAVIRCIEPAAAQAVPDPLALIESLASRGLWYDAIALLGQQIDSRPDEASLRMMRADLLAQQDLVMAAAHEQKRKP